MKCLLLSLLFLICTACVQESETSAISPPPDLFNPSDIAAIPLHWNSASLPLSIKISSSFSGDEKNYIEEMKGRWNQVGAIPTLFTASSTLVSEKNYDEMKDYYDNEFGIYKVQNWYPEIGNTALAVTQFFAARRNIGTTSEYLEIVHADILVNINNFTFGTNLEANKYDLPSVILHELGHVLGLKHETAQQAIMYPYLGVGSVRRALHDIDKNNIRDLYGTSSLSAFQMASEALQDLPAEENSIIRGVIEIHPNEVEKIWFEYKSTRSRSLQMKWHNH